MLMAESYLLKEKLHTNGHIDIYRGENLADKSKVLVKLPHDQKPYSEDISILQHEYFLLKKLQIPGVIKTYGLVMHNNIPALILENIEGKTLKEFFLTQSINLDLFLNLALQLVDVIGKLHQRNIIYKNINSTNVIVDNEILKLTDFSLSTQLPEENLEFTTIEQSNETLAYHAPEQTGRVNRPVDYRTDFYSIGVILFEMLTGRVPFQAEDKLELLHYIIAKPAPLVTEYNPNIPPIVAEIIEKLLSKMPEERYSSIIGLKYDLQKCAEQWQEYGYIKSFKLGKKDINDHLHISHHLYGRKKQVKELMEAFERVEKGKSHLVLVAGYSGVGKTSLIKETHKPIVKRKGYFIQGKFDQLKSAQPFSAIVTAFQSLVKQVLAQSETQLAEIKQNLLTSLDGLGQVVIDVIPEVELIIGKQPRAPKLTSAEMQHRFNLIFQKFMQVFAQKNHPVVIFLDDLQWADNASLIFIQNILTNPDVHHLLIIGAYRDNEVDSSHPLLISLRQLEKAKVNFQTIVLKPLELENTTKLLVDTLSSKKEEISQLADCIFEKTHGNPFFINIFLKMLYQEQILAFSYKEKAWKWNMAKIQEQGITDNVIDLLTVRIHQLTQSTQETLKLASCFGHRFNLKTLTIVSQEFTSKIAQQLWEAIQANLIVHLNEVYKTTTLAVFHSDENKTRVDKLNYRFAHDRVQQAVYQLIPRHTRTQIHLKIGRLLLKERPLEENDERLFEIMEHFNHSLTLIENPKEKRLLAKYNLWAGNKAKSSTAYLAAKEYLQAGTDLLQPLDWENDYELIYDLYKNLAACKYLTGEFQEAEFYFKLLINNSKNLLDKIEIYRLNCEMLSTLNKHDEAIELGRHALKILHIKIPRRPNTLQILYIIFKIKMLIGKRSIPDIVLKPITDPKHRATVDLITQLLNNAFIVDQKLFTALISINIYLSLQYGYTDSNAMSFPVYAFAIMHSLYMYQEGLDFVELNHKMKLKYGESSFEGKNQFILGSFIEPYRENIKKCQDILSHGFQLTCNSGDLVYANYCNVVLTINAFLKGESLASIKRCIQDGIDFINKAKVTDFSGVIKFWNYIIECMEDKNEFSSEVINVIEQKILAGKSKTELNFFYSSCTQLYYLFSEYEKTLEVSKKFEHVSQYSLGLTNNVYYQLYYALAMIAHYQQVSILQRFHYRKKLKKFKRNFRRWAKWCPKNFKPYFLLFQAEYASLMNRKMKAMNLYADAIKHALATNSLYLAAIANECAGRFYLNLKIHALAKVYLNEAYNYYKDFGVISKCKLLKQQYNEIIEDDNSKHALMNIGKEEELDLIAVFKSAEVISSEIQLDKLRQKLLFIVLEVASAERVVILAKKGDRWLIEADGNLEKQKIYLSQEVEATEHKNLPMSLLNYVRRTEQPLIIQDVNSVEIATIDPYVIREKPKSLLIIPVLYQGKLCRMLYLENKFSSQVFTSQHLKSLQLLASQAMISLENAQLYHQASHDALTGLANRNLLDQLFKFSTTQASRSNKQTALFFLDLDNFKAINDTLGHEIGDKLLIHVTNQIKKCLRIGDIAARLGGDEFAVMLVSLDDITQIKSIADRLFRYITKPITILGHQVQITSSMGICLYPKDATDLQTLLKFADIALYQAKEKGKNQYFFYSEKLQEQYRQIHLIEIELQKAFEQEQFEVYYQPIVDTHHNEIISFEALLRWHHPTKGLIEAKDFIEILEKNPLILPVSKWVIYQVCQQASEWEKQGLLKVPIAINVSAVQFSRQSLSKLITEILRKFKLDVSFLEIELTESTFIDSNNTVFNEINNLRELGIKLVIDDFGTGYSSLGYLKRLPISKIKIDQSFFGKSQSDMHDQAIIQAITALAHKLNLQVIAEGIENETQLSLVRELGIDAIQGYYFCPPLSPEKCEHILKNKKLKKF